MHLLYIQSTQRPLFRLDTPEIHPFTNELKLLTERETNKQKEFKGVGFQVNCRYITTTNAMGWSNNNVTVDNYFSPDRLSLLLVLFFCFSFFLPSIKFEIFDT